MDVVATKPNSLDRKNLRRGLLVSLVGHACLFYLIFFHYGGNFADFGKPMVYSVSIEGGRNLGGISQVPKESKEKNIAPPKKVTAPEQSSKIIEKPAEKKVEKKAEEKREILLKEKKIEEKKKEESKKEESKKKETVKAKEPSVADINKSLQQAMQRYLGESSDAGGKGFGAGALGAKGMGGGIVKPPEFHIYRKLLENSIKKGWRWNDTSQSLKAAASFRISTDGRISDVAIVKSSGNSEFDDSVLRAIYKANPLPPAPAVVYSDFKFIEMLFDPRELY